MTVFNYIRVSTAEQSEDRQRIAMEIFNEENGRQGVMLIDKASGSTKERPQLQVMLNALNEGDLVVIKSLDRLSRDYAECKELWRTITEVKCADIVVLDMPTLDTRLYKDLLGNFISNLIVEVLAYVSEQETSFRKQRQREGIEAARLKGKHLGRPSIEMPSQFAFEYSMWRAGNQTAKETFTRLDLTRSTFYKLVKEYEENKIV